MDDFELEIKNDFINEALLNLEEAESAFMDLESTDDRKPLLELIFRLAHNLKGGARAVGFADVAEFTHHLENLVLKIQKNEVNFSGSLVTTLLQSNDRLVEMLSALKADLSATFENADLIEEIKKHLEGSSAPQAETVIPETEITEDQTTVALESLDSSVPEQAPPAVDHFFESPASAVAELAAAPALTIADKSIEKPKDDKGDKNKTDEVVRVSLAKVDMLNDYVGELIVWQSVVQQQSAGQFEGRLSQSLQQILKISKEIQEISMSLRLLPVKPLIQKLQRVVRDTSQALGKEIDLIIEGDQMEIDKSVLDRLNDPLIHILRNGVDHGVELPEERLKAGKGPRGRLELSFRNDGNALVVDIRDDGNGIDPQRLRTKAIEKGIIKETDNLNERQLLNLVFHAGFSTKTVTTEVSGRGVGMDVVKTNIEKAGGQVEIQSVVGKGSYFCLKIPLSLAVIDGLVVMAGGERHIVPLSQVHEMINLRTQEIFMDKSGLNACFDLRGEIVPVVSVAELVTQKRVPVRTDQAAIIIKHRDKFYALAVDDILRSQQVVIKPLASGMPAQKGWIGSCILGDGLPTLILSATDLIENRVLIPVSKETPRSAA